MNTREIATEYRLSHWSEIMRDRKASGLSIKAYCKNAGFHENVYYYWQKRLREATCSQLMNLENQTNLTPIGFTEIKLSETRAMPPAPAGFHGQLQINTGGIQITADCGYPVEKLAVLLREVTRSC